MYVKYYKMYQDSLFSTACVQEDIDVDEENEDFIDDDRDLDDQDESDEGIFNFIFILRIKLSFFYSKVFLF
jgi:hypothetical protein